MSKDEEKLPEELEKLDLDEKEEEDEDWYNEDNDQWYKIEFKNFPPTAEKVEVFCFLNQNPGSHPIPEDDVVKIEFYKDQPGAGVVTLKNEIAFALGMSMDKLKYKKNKIQIRSLEDPEVTDMVSKKVHIPDLKSDKNVEPRIVSSQSSTAKSKDTSKIASLRRQEEKLAARERRGQRDAQKKTSPAPERRDAMPKRHTQYRSAQRGGQAVSRQSSPERRRTGGYEQNQAQSSQRGGTREPRPATQADASLEDKRRAWSSKNTEGRNSFDSKKFVRLNEKIDEKNSAMPRLKLNIEDFVKPSGERRMDIFGAGKSRDEIKKEREALDRGVGTGTGTAKREGKREGREKPKGHGFNKYANLTNAQ